jgi:acetylornithine deacetylase/succinyl-diaminopimelate desuccinylase-like protein
MGQPAVSNSRSGDDRLYGRSASDDKAPIEAILVSLDAMKAAPAFSRPRTSGSFFEGEEEAASAHSAPNRREDTATFLKTDLWLFCDGPVDQSRKQQIYFGARGHTNLDVKIFGPTHELHSGHLRELGSQSGNDARPASCFHEGRWRACLGGGVLRRY